MITIGRFKRLSMALALAAVMAAIILSACGKSAKQRQIGGIYSFGGDGDSPSGTVYIYPETDSSALFYLEKNIGAPSYNSGSIDGRMTVSDGKGTFRNNEDCALQFEFNGDTLTITQDTEAGNCGFGNRVFINDTFLRTTSKIPQSYTVGDMELYFKNISAKLDNATETSVIDLDTVVIDETRLVIIFPDKVDETGDVTWYGSLTGDVYEKLGIETTGFNERDGWLSFALDNGEYEVVNMKEHTGLLYKKGKKPISVGWLDSEGYADYMESHWKTVAEYLGMKESDAIRLLKLEKLVEIAPGLKLPPPVVDGSSIRVWGWSKTGNAAISHSRDHDGSGECVKFFIMSAVTDKILFDVSVCSDEDPDLGEEFELWQVYKKKAAEIEEALKEFNIEPHYTELQQFPFKQGGFEYSANIQTHWRDDIVVTGADDEIKEYKIVIGKNKSEKAIASFDVLGDTYLQRVDSIDGYFQDPFANRILVVSTLRYAFMVSGYDFSGCNLEKGFVEPAETGKGVSK